jgi:hypothetical protein
MTLTTYIVLRRDDEDGKEIGDMLKWTVVGRYDAKSADTALRAIATNLLDGKAGIFVATPERSWRPVTVRTETTTTIRLDTPAPE